MKSRYWLACWIAGCLLTSGIGGCASLNGHPANAGISLRQQLVPAVIYLPSCLVSRSFNEHCPADMRTLQTAFSGSVHTKVIRVEQFSWWDGERDSFTPDKAMEASIDARYRVLMQMPRYYKAKSTFESLYDAFSPHGKFFHFLVVNIETGKVVGQSFINVADAFQNIVDVAKRLRDGLIGPRCERSEQSVLYPGYQCGSFALHEYDD